MPPGRLRTYTGALHIHTSHGGDLCTLGRLVRAAKKAEIDFLVLTDHGSLGPFPESDEGWNEGVLVLRGEEVLAPDGHLLAFETRQSIGTQESVAAAVEAVHEQSGVAVSIHHQLPRGRRGDKPSPPDPLPLDRAGLVEVWSFMDEFLARVRARSLATAVHRPERLITGPPRHLLQDWDRQLATRMLPAVGGLNLHSRKHPLLDWRELFPPEPAFGSIVTCVRTGELPTVAMRARDMVWAALREGRSYIANRAVGTEKGFEFEYLPPTGRVRHMGDNHPYVVGGRLRVRVPDPAEIVIRHKGQPLFWGTGDELTFPTVGPGAYRVEVYLDRRLWLLSNPIRLLDDEGLVQPTVSDVT